MIKVKVGELVHPQFKGALVGLMGQEMSFGSAFQIKALLKKVEKAITDAEDIKIEILTKYCEVDADGNLVPNTDEEGKPIQGSVKPIDDPEKKQEFMTKWGEYLNTEVEIDAPKLDPQSLSDTKVTINDLEFLDVFLKKDADLRLV